MEHYRGFEIFDSHLEDEKRAQEGVRAYAIVPILMIGQPGRRDETTEVGLHAPTLDRMKIVIDEWVDKYGEINQMFLRVEALSSKELARIGGTEPPSKEGSNDEMDK